MKDFLLDTNTLSFALKGREAVLAGLEEAARQGRGLLLAPVVHFELTRYLDLKGAHRLRRQYDLLVAAWYRCEMTFDDWTAASSLWAERHRIGRSLSDLDLLLAVLTRKYGAILVTNNVRHFEGLGIPLEDWLGKAESSPPPEGTAEPAR